MFLLAKTFEVEKMVVFHPRFFQFEAMENFSTKSPQLRTNNNENFQQKW